MTLNQAEGDLEVSTGDMTGQYTSIRYTNRLLHAGAVASIWHRR